jgi:hypothetical protein
LRANSGCLPIECYGTFALRLGLTDKVSAFALSVAN